MLFCCLNVSPVLPPFAREVSRPLAVTEGETHRAAVSFPAGPQTGVAIRVPRSPFPAPAGAELPPPSVREVSALCADGGRDDFRLCLRKTVCRGGTLPLPPFLHNVSGGVEPRPYACLPNERHTAQRCHCEPVCRLAWQSVLRVPFLSTLHKNN